MSEQNHTPEPWFSYAADDLIVCKDGGLIADLRCNPNATMDKMRIDHCVNACRGMTNPEEEIARLRKIEADAKAANMLDDNGNFRLPSSALFRTKDGAVIKPGDCVWVPGKSCRFEVDDDGTVAFCIKDSGEWRDLRVDECYSTPEAAEQAGKVKP